AQQVAHDFALGRLRQVQHRRRMLRGLRSGWRHQRNRAEKQEKTRGPREHFSSQGLTRNESGNISGLFVMPAKAAALVPRFRGGDG
ncbi:MAG TPA: hypothetical protein VGF34_02005, partial [Stellaceae bacterium]